MNISGKIKLIGETKEYGTNGFRKRELVVTTQEQYPQNILVEFVQGNDWRIGEDRQSNFYVYRTAKGKQHQN